jgi:hypothetical protein
MVLMLLIITRYTMNLQRYITMRHLDKMAKVTMLTGMIVSYAYLTEFFAAWYGGNIYERYHFINRATGPYAWCFYLMVLCNVVTPQMLWFKKARSSVAFLFIISIMVNIGMWFERFVIIVVSLHRAFLPSGWGMFYPTAIDIGVLVGSFGLFFTCFLLFIRVLPMIAMWEIKGEEYLKKLAAQELVLGRDQRLLAENLAKGRVAAVFGLTYYSYLPFVKAGLPIKPVPQLKEGTYGTGGSGNLAIIKAPAHPNATKVFVNWVLSREGQEIVTKALGQATRRLDVDTKWMRESGVIPAKDTMSVKDFLQVENQSEEKLDRVREPAAKFAQAILR